MKEFSKKKKVKIIDKIIDNLDTDYKDNWNYLCHIYKDVVHPNSSYYYNILDKAKIEFPEFYEMIIKTYVYLYNKNCPNKKFKITYKEAVSDKGNTYAWSVEILKSFKHPRYTYKLHKLKVLKRKILNQ